MIVERMCKKLLGSDQADQPLPSRANGWSGTLLSARLSQFLEHARFTRCSTYFESLRLFPVQGQLTVSVSGLLSILPVHASAAINGNGRLLVVPPPTERLGSRAEFCSSRRPPSALYSLRSLLWSRICYRLFSFFRGCQSSVLTVFFPVS